MMLSQGVDEVGGGDRFTDAVFPAASLDEIIEQESDDVIGLKESSVLVYDAEAVGVTIGGDADVGVGFAHFLAKIVEQMVVRFRGMAAEEHVAVIVHGRDFNSGFLQQGIGIVATGAPEGIEHDSQASFLNCLEID